MMRVGSGCGYAGADFLDGLAFDEDVGRGGAVGGDDGAVADQCVHEDLRGWCAARVGRRKRLPHLDPGQAWVRSSQDCGGRPVSICSMVMQFSTGQTSQQRLQPTHSSSSMRGMRDGGSCAAGGWQGIQLGDRGGDYGWATGVAVQVNALVRAIPAGDVAEIAADARVAVDARHDPVIEIEVLPLGDLGQREAAEIVEGAEAFFVHPVGEAVDHVFHDAIAVVHGGGADLHGAASEQDELGGLAPAGDAADAGDGQADFGIGGDLLDQVQGDGLHRRAAIAAVRRAAAHVGARRERVEIDAGDGIDGVDGGEGVGAAAAGGARHGADVGDVGGELDEHRGAGHFLDPFGDHAGVVGHLADGAAHAALAHAVGAAEVQLEAVGAGVFGALDDVVPGFALGIDHQGGDDGVLGIALFDLGDFAEVDFDGAVGDQLDVVQAHHALAVPIDRGIARGDVDDGLADGLPDGAAPAGVEGAHDLIAAVGGRAGGEPEGVGAADAGEVSGEVSHGRTARGSGVRG